VKIAAAGKTQNLQTLELLDILQIYAIGYQQERCNCARTFAQ